MKMIYRSIPKIDRIIPKDSVRDISYELLREDGKMKLLPAEMLKKYRWDDFRSFCHTYARYGIPTYELISYLTNIIGDRQTETIEIGAGAGDLGCILNIPMTDSRQQENPDIKAAYDAMHQPIIKYPEDVEKLDALEAVYKYKPKVVIGSWITPYAPHQMPYGSNPFGVKEDKILKLVETFIIIGNLDIHGDKPIREHEHKTIIEPWIVSRAKDQSKNCIFIWDKG